MQLRYKFELRCQLDRLIRHNLDSAKILFSVRVGWVGGGGWEDYSKNKTNLSQRFSWSWGWAWQQQQHQQQQPLLQQKSFNTI